MDARVQPAPGGAGPQGAAAEEEIARRAAWSDEGEPLNVEAAIADALEWLEVLRVQPIIRRSMDNEVRLRAALYAIASYGDVETRTAYQPEPEDEP
jgi:DNA-binding transcriptional regulator LsrR (DeoR family)